VRQIEQLAEILAQVAAGNATGRRGVIGVNTDT
jgi:hypothetical protein